MRLSLAIAIALLGCATAPADRASVAPPASAPANRVAASPPPSVASPPREVRLAASVERSRLEKDVAWLAKPRPPNSPHQRQVRKMLGQRLEKLGFDLERHAYGSGVNLIGRRPGTDSRAEQLIVSAHYDHVPRCPGADDNASGVASVLEVARVLGEAPHAHGLVIAFWDEEERALTGSRAFAARARERGEPIRLAISLDAVGYASAERGSQKVPNGFERVLPKQAALLADRGYAGDFIALVASSGLGHAVDAFERHADAARLPVISLELSPIEWLAVPDVFRSDHAAFWQQGYPAMLLSDTAELRNPGYHCMGRRDTPQTLDYEFLARVTDATARTAAELLE